METHGWRLQMHRQAEHTLRRYRCHQDGGGRITAFQISLHDEAAQRVRDQRGAPAEAVSDGADVIDVVGDRAGVKTLRGGTAAVSAQAHRHRAVTRVGEEVHEIRPARRRMPPAVHEQQWHRMRLADGALIDHLEHALIVSH
jgi:hypothetical protein